jgi:hypothetical protein
MNYNSDFVAVFCFNVSHVQQLEINLIQMNSSLKYHKNVGKYSLIFRNAYNIFTKEVFKNLAVKVMREVLVYITYQQKNQNSY